MKRIFVILIAALLLLPCLAAPAAAMDIAVDDGWDESDDPYYRDYKAAMARAERIEAGISFAVCVAALVTLIVFIVLRAKKSVPVGRFLAVLAVLAVFVALRAVYLVSLF